MSHGTGAGTLTVGASGVVWCGVAHCGHTLQVYCVGCCVWCTGAQFGLGAKNQ